MIQKKIMVIVLFNSWHFQKETLIVSFTVVFAIYYHLMSIMMKMSFFSNLTPVVGIHNKHSDPENIQIVQIIYRSNLLEDIAREFYIFM